jgi:hypothetical protein
MALARSALALNGVDVLLVERGDFVRGEQCFFSHGNGGIIILRMVNFVSSVKRCGNGTSCFRMRRTCEPLPTTIPFSKDYQRINAR